MDDVTSKLALLDNANGVVCGYAHAVKQIDCNVCAHLTKQQNLSTMFNVRVCVQPVNLCVCTVIGWCTVKPAGVSILHRIRLLDDISQHGTCNQLGEAVRHSGQVELVFGREAEGNHTVPICMPVNSRREHICNMPALAWDFLQHPCLPACLHGVCRSRKVLFGLADTRSCGCCSQWCIMDLSPASSYWE